MRSHPRPRESPDHEPKGWRKPSWYENPLSQKLVRVRVPPPAHSPHVGQGGHPMSRALLALLLIAVTAPFAHTAAPPPRTQWIAVVAPDFVDALAPLVKARRAQGMRVVV